MAAMGPRTFWHSSAAACTPSLRRVVITVPSRRLVLTRARLSVHMRSTMTTKPTRATARIHHMKTPPAMNSLPTPVLPMGERSTTPIRPLMGWMMRGISCSESAAVDPNPRESLVAWILANLAAASEVA